MKYTKEIIQEAVSKSLNISETIRNMGAKLSGGMHNHISNRIKHFQIDISHFRPYEGNSQRNKNRAATQKKHFSEILVKNEKSCTTTKRLRRAMIESGIEYSCVECGCDGTWMNKEIVLEIDHVDGDRLNNLENNVRFMCPNCHSQTENYRSKNRSKPYSKHKHASVV